MTAVPTVQIAFHAVIAAVCAQVAAVLAPFKIASFAYKACKYKVSALSFTFRAIFASIAFFSAINTVTRALTAFAAFMVSFASPTIFIDAIAPATPIIIGFSAPHSFNFW